MDIKFENSQIDGGVFKGAQIGDNNIMVGSNNTTDVNFVLYEEFCDYMDEILVNSNDRNERKCANEAKKIAEQQNKSKLKNFIIDNILTFATGTFATTAGGLLLKFIQDILR